MHHQHKAQFLIHALAPKQIQAQPLNRLFFAVQGKSCSLKISSASREQLLQFDRLVFLGRPAPSGFLGRRGFLGHHVRFRFRHQVHAGFRSEVACIQPLQGRNRQEVPIQKQQCLTGAFRGLEALFNHLNDMGMRLSFAPGLLPAPNGLDTVF